MAKSNPFDMGNYLPTEQEEAARLWCMRNNIYISPIAIKEALWTIIIENKGSKNKDPNNYNKNYIWQKVYEYYKYYYNKYENKI